MKTRTEHISSLAYAISVLLGKLGHYFEKEPWWSIDNGFKIEIKDRSRSVHLDTQIIIHPIGWNPKLENIVVRLNYLAHSSNFVWSPFEGSINKNGVHQINFKIATNKVTIL